VSRQDAATPMRQVVRREYECDAGCRCECATLGRSSLARTP